MSAPSYTPQLRPLSVGEMLDAGFRLFNARFVTLVLCVLVPVAPLLIVSTLLQASVNPAAFDVDSTETVSGGTALAGTLIGWTLQYAAAALAIAACFRAISAAYLGEQAGVGESLRYGLGRLLPLFVAWILFLIIFLIGFVALFIPCIWLGTKFSMTFPAVMFERKGPFRALGRSWSLTRGNFWRTLGTLLVAVLIWFVLQLVVGIFVGAVLGASNSISELTVAIVVTLLNLIVLALTYPLWAAVTTVIYYDLRVRNEGFDLQLLAQGMGADTTRFEAAPERPVAPPPEPATGGFAPPEGRPTSP